MKFNEDSRVKIPTILHLMRLGYEYISLPSQKWDESTNIFTDIFHDAVKRLNPELSDGDLDRVYDDVALCLENEYEEKNEEYLISHSQYMLIGRIEKINVGNNHLNC